MHCQQEIWKLFIKTSTTKTCFNSNISSLNFKTNYFYYFSSSNNSHLLSLLVLVGWVFGKFSMGQFRLEVSHVVVRWLELASPRRVLHSYVRYQGWDDPPIWRLKQLGLPRASFSFYGASLHGLSSMAASWQLDFLHGKWLRTPRHIPGERARLKVLKVHCLFLT